jgi:hypothetical protein
MVTLRDSASHGNCVTLALTLTLNRRVKAVLKPPHAKRWCDHPASSNFAERLECGVFTAAFRMVGAVPLGRCMEWEQQATVPAHP